MNNLAATLVALSGQQNTIAVPVAFAEFMGGLEAGAVLSQLVYWSDGRTTMHDGWIAKADAELADEIKVSSYRIRKTRSLLESMGVVDTEVRKFDGAPTLHYKVDLNALERLWSVFIGDRDGWAETRSKLESGEIRSSDIEKSNLRDRNPDLAISKEPINRAYNRELETERTRKAENKPTSQQATKNPGGKKTTEAGKDLDFVERFGRESLPEHERMDFMEFQNEWRQTLRDPYPVSNPLDRDRLIYVLEFWTRDELREAMITTAKSCSSRYRWGFFAAVLADIAKPADEKRSSAGGRRDYQREAASAGMSLFEKLAQQELAEKKAQG